MIRAVPYTSLWLGVSFWVLVLGGLLAGTTWQLYEDYIFTYRAHSTQATVDRKFTTVSHGKHGTTHTPHLDYEYHVDNLVVHAETSVQWATYNQERQGWVFPVVYEVDEVANNRINLPAENQQVRFLTFLLIGGSLLLAGGGAGVLIYHVRQNKRYRYLRAGGVACQGVVTDVPSKFVGKSRAPRYYLVFTFRDSRGEEIRGTTWYLKSGQEAFWKVGSSIPVYFDSSNPKRFTVDLGK